MVFIYKSVAPFEPYGQQRLPYLGEPAWILYFFSFFPFLITFLSSFFLQPADAMANYASLVNTVDRIWEGPQMRRNLLPRHPITGCQEAKFAPSKAKGYTQVRINGSKYYVHIVSAMYKWKRAPKADEEASHLCHNPACVNPDHLVLENGEVNKSRGCCKLFGAKPGYRCPHTPACPECVPL